VTRDSRICVAKIGAAHGVRGEVKLWPFTEDPMAVIDYGPLSSKDGARQFEVVRARIAKDHLDCRVPFVAGDGVLEGDTEDTSPQAGVGVAHPRGIVAREPELTLRPELEMGLV
jgi:hypothetical protein